MLAVSEGILIDTKRFPDEDISYHRGRFFINFADKMFETDIHRTVIKMMSFFCQHKLHENLYSVDRIVICSNSNFLLGEGLSKRLGKSCVKILSTTKGRVFSNQLWDGTLECSDRVIIVLDVVVSGEQIISSINKIPQTCEILGVYCMIYRKEWDFRKRLMEEFKINIFSIIELSDQEIEEMVNSINN